MELEQKVCGHCGYAATSQCRQYRNTKYCSVECQVADWFLILTKLSFAFLCTNSICPRPAHKLLCASFANFKDRPSPTHRRAILLPEHSSKPVFVWVNGCRDIKSDDHYRKESESKVDEESRDKYRTSFPSKSTSIVPLSHKSKGFDYGVSHRERQQTRTSPEFGSFLAQTSSLGFQLLVHANVGYGSDLDHSIHVAYIPRLLSDGSDGSMPNKCISRLANRKNFGFFRGPMILYAMSRFGVRYRDLDTNNLTPGRNGLLELYEREKNPTLPDLKLETKGVKIIYEAERSERTHSPVTFQEVAVPLDHPIFTEGKSSAVSKGLGPTYKTYCYPEGSSTSTGSAVSPAAYLHINLKVGAKGTEGFGTISEDWRREKRDVLVVRKDKNALDSRTVSAMCLHCESVLDPQS